MDKKQKLLVEYLISSPETFALCSPLLKTRYFDNDGLKRTISFLQKYYNDYSALPGVEQIETETGINLKIHDITKDKLEYCIDEVEKFCREKAMWYAIEDSAKIYDGKEGEPDYGKIYKLVTDAATVSLHRDMGMSFFDDPEETLKRMMNAEIYEPTGWKEFDELVGGCARKQLVLFMANSGVGKSITLANLALNYVEKGYNALYISLELSEEMIYERYIAMVAKVATKEWKKQKDDVAKKITLASEKCGTLFIKRMAQGSTPNQFRAYLKEFELKNKISPDVIIIDYIDIMSPNEQVSADNVFEKDKLSSEQIREIGNDYNAIVASAAQQNREAIKAMRIDQSHIAGGLSKINTADLVASIEQTPAMRARGEIMFIFIKTRSSQGVGEAITLKYNPTTLRITSSESFSMDSFKKKEDEGPEKDKIIDTHNDLLELATFINS